MLEKHFPFVARLIANGAKKDERQVIAPCPETVQIPLVRQTITELHLHPHVDVPYNIQQNLLAITPLARYIKQLHNGQYPKDIFIEAKPNTQYPTWVTEQTSSPPERVWIQINLQRESYSGSPEAPFVTVNITDFQLTEDYQHQDIRMSQLFFTPSDSQFLHRSDTVSIVDLQAHQITSESILRYI